MTPGELVLAMRDIKGQDIDRIIHILEQILTMLQTISEQLAEQSE